MTIQAPKTEVVDKWNVACDGGKGGSGHPRVWVGVSHDDGAGKCDYCGQVYVHQDFPDAAK